MAVDVKRPSHDHLMAATEALGLARDAEQAAGNGDLAMGLNSMSLMLFKTAIDSSIPDASRPARIAEANGHTVERVDLGPCAVDRWTCTVCGASVHLLLGGGDPYGDAVERACDGREQADG